MTPERWQRLQKLLEAALALPAGQRTAYLDTACAGDPETRREVETLLAFDEESDQLLDTPLLAAGGGDPRLGSRVGPYTLLSLLARGGMGTVYLAERAGEYRQQVALKLIRRRRFSPESIRRFHHERQILAQLEHPHIPRILDGGTTDDGLPYFVMEYVQGEPIDRWCAARQLSVEARLELFGQVLEAVHFSHQHLVIHRDLKPGNILVTGDGTAKLLDFGIAKLIPEPWAAGEPATATAGAPMTLLYASPEQVGGKPVTTRSDVYSLGVLLYRLLTGHHPYLDGGPPAPAAVIEAICHTEPTKPSSAAAAGHPSRESRRLRRRLAGDLDSIVLKAMRKEPRHRYGSVEQMAEDLRRHLTGLPVTARQGRWTYRAGKLLRRNKLALAVAAMILGFSLAVTVLWSEARQQRDEAVRAREQAEGVTDFLLDLFEQASPDRAKGKELTVRDLLDLGRERIGQALEGEPAVSARLLTRLGRVYRQHGLYDVAKEIFEQALDIERQHFSRTERHAWALNNLGGLLYRQGEGAAAERLYCEALEIYRELARGGSETGSEIARTMDNLALIYRNRGHYEHAETLYRKGLEIRRELHGEESESVASSLYNLGALYRAQDNLEQAEPLLRRALEIRRRVLEDPGHTAVVSVMNTLARVLLAQGDTARAGELFQQVLDLRRERLAEDHPDVARSRRDLAAVQLARGDAAAAERELAGVLEILRPLKSEGDWEIGLTESLRGACLVQLGRFEEAEPLLARGWESLQAGRGDGARDTRDALEQLIRFYEQRGRPAEAAAYRARLDRPLPPEAVEASSAPCEDLNGDPAGP